MPLTPQSGVARRADPRGALAGAAALGQVAFLSQVPVSWKQDRDPAVTHGAMAPSGLVTTSCHPCAVETRGTRGTREPAVCVRRTWSRRGMCVTKPRKGQQVCGGKDSLPLLLPLTL